MRFVPFNGSSPTIEETPMNASNRRRFLQQAGAGAAIWSVGAATARAATDGLVLGVIGPGGMGMNHTRLLASRKDVKIAYVCDVDSNRLEAAAKEVETRCGVAPKAVKDMRQVF